MKSAAARPTGAERLLLLTVLSALSSLPLQACSLVTAPDEAEFDCSSDEIVLYYPDCDQDGHGHDRAVGIPGCEGVPPAHPACGVVIGAAWSNVGDDCDDDDDAVNPGLAEVCDGVDTNCDGEWFDGEDADGDGFGGPQCGGSDCDDLDPNVNPDAVEVCDLRFTNCAGYGTRLAEDADGDGFAPDHTCDANNPLATLAAGDCDDTNPDVYPGAPEICDRIHNDCNSPQGGTVAVEEDADDDGFASITASCEFGPRPRSECPSADSDPLWRLCPPTATLAAASMSHGIASGDINLDGFIDIVSASTTDGSVTWWESDGAGGWTAHPVLPPQSDWPTSRWAALVAVGPVDDADAYPDIVVGYDALDGVNPDRKDILLVRSLDGGQTFEPPIEVVADGGGLRDLQLVDVDDDCLLDVVGIGKTTASYINGGGATPSFTPSPIYDVSGSSIWKARSADVDDDGDADLIVALYSRHDVAWLENPTLAGPGLGGPWAVHVITPAADNPRGVAAADIDGDGTLDVVAASAATNSIRWWANTAGDGSQWVENLVAFETVEAGSSQGLAAGDIDGDGDVDLLASGDGDGEVSWFENVDGVGKAWLEQPIDTLSGHQGRVLLADFDDDGDPDFAADGVSGVYAWRNHSSSPIAWTREDLGVALGLGGNGFAQMRVVELDGLPGVDVILPQATAVLWLAEDGGSWTQRTISPSENLGSVVFVEVLDVNVDGRPDIVVVRNEGGGGERDSIVWLEQPVVPTDSWVVHDLAAGSAANEVIVSMDVVDVDGRDGPDLVTAHSRAGNHRIRVLRNPADSSSTWEAIVVEDPATSPRSARFADMDQDGDPDIVAGVTGNQHLAWWENQSPPGSELGDGSVWARHLIRTGIAAPLVVAGDVDGDGDLDVAAFDTLTCSLSWYENEPGGSWPRHDLPLEDPLPLTCPAGPDPGCPDVRAIELSDLDADNDLDLMIGISGDRVAWLENPGVPASAWRSHETWSGSESVRAGLFIGQLGLGGPPYLLGILDDDLVRWSSDGAMWWQP